MVQSRPLLHPSRVAGVVIRMNRDACCKPATLKLADMTRMQHGSMRTSVRGTQSFIDRAAHQGAKSLLGAFPSFGGRFDEVLKKVSIDKIENGEVQVSFVVDETHANGYGTLHGGFTATLVDVVGTLALISKDKDKAGVSLDINVSYMNAAAIGQKVICIGRLLRIGQSFGFTQVDLIREEDGKLLATGRHTKAFPNSPKKH